MLISPIRLHDNLNALLQSDPQDGPHTALLITPAGQLLCHATLPDDDDDGDDDGQDGDDGAGPNGNIASHDDPDGDDGDADDVMENGQDDEEDELDEEPWLDGPERLRLLIGLASQWEEDESPRVECELGRLFLRPISLPEPDTASPGIVANGLPLIRPPRMPTIVLVLNGTSQTPWTALAHKADTFLSKWY